MTPEVITVQPGSGADASRFKRPPVTWRDPWLIGALLAPIVLLALLAPSRMGEPVADDYDFLYQVVLAPSWSWLDGGGASNYWRPVARQLYYALLAPWILHFPLGVALLQTACLCLAGALLYLAFRRHLTPRTAFAVSTGPWMMESSRLLIAWPACFQDLGALLFVAVALHEAAAGRRWSYLAAGLVSLLCKEVAAVALVAILFCPLVCHRTGRERIEWFAWTGLLLLVWTAVYAWVQVHGSLSLPGPSNPGTVDDWARAAMLTAWWCLKGLLSLPASSGPLDVLLVIGLVLLIPWSRLAHVLGNQKDQLGRWWVFGLVWSVPLMVVLIPLYPVWAPYRLAFTSFGILSAAMVTLSAVHPRALVVALALRLALLVVAPRPVGEVSADPPSRGASIDVPRLSRLQSLLADVRSELKTHHPQLPGGATIVREGFPALTEYAFGSDRALRVWYRDSTLRWVPISRWMADLSRPVATVVEFQGEVGNVVALVAPEAMRAMLQANRELALGNEAMCLRWLTLAEQSQTDTSATVFRRAIAGKRAYALARLSLKEARFAESRSYLLQLLATHPGDVPGRRLLEEVEDSLADATQARRR